MDWTWITPVACVAAYILGTLKRSPTERTAYAECHRSQTRLDSLIAFVDMHLLGQTSASHQTATDDAKPVTEQKATSPRDGWQSVPEPLGRNG